MRFKTFLQVALFSITSILFSNASALAQELPAPQPEQRISDEQQMINQLPESVRSQMKPGVRYTIGAVTNKGWEHGLVKGNNGLKHFFWAPVTSMVQASPSQRTKAQATSAQPQQPRKEFHYIKPQRAALPSNPAAIAAPPPQRAVARRLPERRDKKDVSAKLAYKNPRSAEAVSGDLTSTETQAKLYADNYKSDQQASGYLTSKDAYGKLLK